MQARLLGHGGWRPFTCEPALVIQPSKSITQTADRAALCLAPLLGMLQLHDPIMTNTPWCLTCTAPHMLAGLLEIQGVWAGPQHQEGGGGQGIQPHAAEGASIGGPTRAPAVMQQACHGLGELRTWVCCPSRSMPLHATSLLSPARLCPHASFTCLEPLRALRFTGTSCPGRSRSQRSQRRCEGCGRPRCAQEVVTVPLCLGWT